jgi:hypothetical protein
MLLVSIVYTCKSLLDIVSLYYHFSTHGVIVVVAQGAEQLPLIKLHPSLSLLSRSLKKTDREHNLVISVTTLYFPFGFTLDGIVLKPTFWFLSPYSN